MIKVLGIPFHFGQKNTGVAKSPQVLRERGLIQCLQKFDGVIDSRDLSFDHLESSPHKISQSNLLIKDAVIEALNSESFLLSIGGDHGMSLGTISGVLQKDPRRVVVWVDAHGDINTPQSSASKNFHGMPLSYLLGLNREDPHFDWMKTFLSPEKLIYFGPRDLDPFERQMIEGLGIQCYSSQDINEKGAVVLLENALKMADPEGLCSIHLSFDVDVFDKNDFQATGISLSNGPHLSQVMALVSEIGKTKRLRSMDLVEYNPEVDSDLEGQKSHKMIFLLLEKIFGVL